MAGIIKSQLLKHLSKFAKNISSNSINVSTLKGEGELFNLELNEEVLTDLLELPNWIKISHASVNKVSLKIQWTKLKSTPIHMSLDEVIVRMETCLDLRKQGQQSNFSSYKSGAKYGFVDKVIDGMTVTVNAVNIHFISTSFRSTFHISRIVLCSKNPNWQLADLRMTRLKDVNQQFLLIFKELTWQTLKIESSSDDPTMTPLRLITNQSCCRMTVKKKMADCSVVGCRLVLLSDAILWVLTDSQLLSAYHLIESLSGLIKKGTEESQREKAARKLESCSSSLSYSFDATTMNVKETTGTSLPVNQNALHKFQIFQRFDVVETSYHFFSERVDLHFCDDPGCGRSSYPELKDGATLQLILRKIRMDYYPYHLANGDRSHWIKYVEGTPYRWTKMALTYFKTHLMNLFNSGRPSHAPLERSFPHSDPFNPEIEKPDGSGNINSIPTREFVTKHFKKLMSSCFLLTCQDMVLYQVLLSRKRNAQVEMLASDKRFSVPEGTSLLQMEFSSFYYPVGFNFPVPPPKMYVCVSPLKVVFDLTSSLWLNAFASHLMKETSKSAPAPPYLDVHMEVSMPRILVEPKLCLEKQEGRPNMLNIFASRFVMSNVRSPDPTNPGSRSALLTCLEAAQNGQLFFASGFPSSDEDKQPIPPKFILHAQGSDSIKSISSNPIEDFKKGNFGPETLWTESRDILFFYLDKVWVEFLDELSSKPSLTFVGTLSLSLWVHIKELSFGLQENKGSDLPLEASLSTTKSNDLEKRSRDDADMHILIYTENLVKVQFNHLQFLFLMRIIDSMTELSAFVAQDTKDILQREDYFLVAGIFPHICLSFVMPNNFPSTDPLVAKPTFLDQLERFTRFGATHDVHSSPSIPSLSEDSRVVGGELSKSQSEGCLSAIAPPSLHLKTELKNNEIQLNSKLASSCLSVGEASSKTYLLNQKDISCHSLQEGKGPVTSPMKRGFNTGFNTVLSALESTVKTPDDMSDTMSISSDVSNESDNFVMLYLESERDNSITGVECAFKASGKHSQSPVEAATEVVEDIVISSPEEFPQCIDYAGDKPTNFPLPIGVVTFHVGHVQFTCEGRGHYSIVKLLTTSLGVEETLDVSADEFQGKFIRSEDFCGSSSGADVKPTFVKLRLSANGIERCTGSGSPVENWLKGRYFHPLPVTRVSTLDATINGAALSLLLKSCEGLGDLLDDELVPIPLSMKVKLENIEIRLGFKNKKGLNDDDCNEYRKISIPKLSVVRDVNGDLMLLPLYLLPAFDTSSHDAANSMSGDARRHSEEELRKELDRTKEELRRCQIEKEKLTKLIAEMKAE